MPKPKIIRSSNPGTLSLAVNRIEPMVNRNDCTVAEITRYGFNLFPSQACRTGFLVRIWIEYTSTDQLTNQTIIRVTKYKSHFHEALIPTWGP